VTTFLNVIAILAAVVGGAVLVVFFVRR